jgi:phytoene dehydrogenase-like protein
VLKARDHGRVVLAYGEVTGHAHAIEDALAELFEEAGGRLYLRADADVALQHEEHATITVPRGVYEVVHQVEYTPQEIRRVAD